MKEGPHSLVLKNVLIEISLNKSSLKSLVVFFFFFRGPLISFHTWQIEPAYFNWREMIVSSKGGKKRSSTQTAQKQKKNTQRLKKRAKSRIFKSDTAQLIPSLCSDRRASQLRHWKDDLACGHQRERSLHTDSLTSLLLYTLPAHYLLTQREIDGDVGGWGERWSTAATETQHFIIRIIPLGGEPLQQRRPLDQYQSHDAMPPLSSALIRHWMHTYETEGDVPELCM